MVHILTEIEIKFINFHIRMSFCFFFPLMKQNKNQPTKQPKKFEKPVIFSTDDFLIAPAEEEQQQQIEEEEAVVNDAGIRDTNNMSSAGDAAS